MRNVCVILSGSILLASSSAVQAAIVLVAKTDTADHGQTVSPFFTKSPDGLITLASSGGWTPAAAQAGTVNSTTTSKVYSILGTSTSAGNWIDGNGIPAGVTAAFTVTFSVAAPAGSYLTTPGNSGTSLGNGIGVTTTLNAISTLDVGESLTFSSFAVSGVSFTGTPTESAYALSGGAVLNYGARIFRSNDFAEATEGATLTKGTDVLGFGLATGNLGNNLTINNNYTDASGTFTRIDGPFVFASTAGSLGLKGIGFGYDVSYDMTLVPEPVTLSGAAALVIGSMRRRRVTC